MECIIFRQLSRALIKPEEVVLYIKGCQGNFPDSLSLFKPA